MIEGNKDTNNNNGVGSRRQKNLVFNNRLKSGKPNSTMRGGGERSASNNNGNIQALTNIQAIDNFIDKQINIKNAAANANGQKKGQAAAA